MMAVQKPRGNAIIVGGGIGGLATAIGLQRIGWRAQVLEQAPTLGEIGAGLSLWPNAIRSLSQLGVGERVRCCGVPAVSRGGLRVPSGDWLRRKHPDDVQVLMLLRADLHRALRGALPEAWLRTGATVTAVDQTAQGATVIYRTPAGARRVSADLVVGADGVHSSTRRQLWPRAAAPAFEGRTVWRAVTRPGAGPVEESITLGPGQQFGMLPLPGTQVYWFLTAAVAGPDVRYPDELAEVRRRLTGWHQPIGALLDATSSSAVLHHDVLTLDPLSSYISGRVALLGDAAHATSPDLGQGACQAIEDAVVLAAALDRQPNVAAALADYDRQRRPRTQALARAAREQARFNANHHRMVTVAARFMPANVWRRQSSRWSEWTPPELPARP